LPSKARSGRVHLAIVGLLISALRRTARSGSPCRDRCRITAILIRRRIVSASDTHKKKPRVRGVSHHVYLQHPTSTVGRRLRGDQEVDARNYGNQSDGCDLAARKLNSLLRFAIAKASLSKVSSAIFFASMQSPATKFPSARKHRRPCGPRNPVHRYSSCGRAGCGIASRARSDEAVHTALAPNRFKDFWR
jgi:hypothetical protein